MPILTNAKHELFAQELAKGKTADEAYKVAGYKENRHNAATLARKQHIQTRVTELLAEREKVHGQATARAIERTALTKEWVIAKLVENTERAMQAVPVTTVDGQTGEYQYQGSVANKALELLGKELGMFIERKEVGKPGEFDHLNADERQRALDAIEAELARREGEATASQPAGPAGPVSALH